MTTTDRIQSAAGLSTEAFAERVLSAVLGSTEVQAMYLGDRLGYYRALAAGGPATASELAARTDTHERYAREWLEHQAVCGYLAVDDVAAAPGERRFTLPAAHAEVLTNDDGLSFTLPLANFVAATGKQVDALVRAYQTGGGVSWEQFGPDAREGQGAANRPMFLGPLVEEYLPSIPEVDAALRGGGRVADVGCGTRSPAAAAAPDRLRRVSRRLEAQDGCPRQTSTTNA